MSWFGQPEDRGSAAKSKVEILSPELDVQLQEGEPFITVNKFSVDKIYNDAMPRLLMVVDEIAELTQKSGLKTTEGKQDDALKDEIMANIQSGTQLGRSSGIHYILCTQRNDASVRKLEIAHCY